MKQRTILVPLSLALAAACTGPNYYGTAPGALEERASQPSLGGAWTSPSLATPGATSAAQPTRFPQAGGAEIVAPPTPGLEDEQLPPLVAEPAWDAGGETAAEQAWSGGGAGARMVSPTPVADSTPAVAQAPGTTAPLPSGARAISPGDESRPFLLELYQDALAERDALRLEVDGVVAELTRARRRGEALEQQLADRDAALVERDARIAQLEERVAAVEAEASDFAQRLVTAQVRRLEAEKLLLESEIAAARGDAPADPNAPNGGGGR